MGASPGERGRKRIGNPRRCFCYQNEEDGNALYSNAKKESIMKAGRKDESI